MNKKRGICLAFCLMIMIVLSGVSIHKKYDTNPDNVVKKLDASHLYGPTQVLSKEEKGDNLVYLGKYNEYYSCHIIEKNHGFLYTPKQSYVGLLPKEEVPFTIISHGNTEYNDQHIPISRTLDLIGMVDDSVVKIEIYEDDNYIKTIDNLKASMFYDNLGEEVIKDYYRLSFFGYDKDGNMIHEQTMADWV